MGIFIGPIWGAQLLSGLVAIVLLGWLAIREKSPGSSAVAVLIGVLLALASWIAPQMKWAGKAVNTWTFLLDVMPKATALPFLGGCAFLGGFLKSRRRALAVLACAFLLAAGLQLIFGFVLSDHVERWLDIRVSGH